MRVLVISDSHRRSDIVKRIISDQPTASHVFFLGDTTADIEELPPEFPDKTFYIVSGNSDVFSRFPSSGVASVAGKKIYYTHGHRLGVKYRTDDLCNTARHNKCDIALYGHTHSPKILYEDGLYLVNPGSCAQSRNGAESYAVIDIENSGIMPFIVKV